MAEHPPTPAMRAPDLTQQNQERYRITRQVTLIGAASNIILATLQFIFGILGHSQALIADGIHSLSDLATDIMGIVGAKHASRDADAEHPYGHGRIETAVTVGLALVLTLAASAIIFDAMPRLFAPQLLFTPHWTVLAVAALSIIVKEVMYHYTLRVAKKIRSNMLQANAWHHRSDSLSSIIVIVGAGGTMAGLPYLDSLAAIGVAVMIARVGLMQGWQSMQELIDHGLTAERVETIRRMILSVHGVNELHLLRTRRMGGNAFVDVHILVDPKLSVSEAHQISESVRGKLIGEIDEVTDVTIHIDPEDDLDAKPGGELPARDVLLKRLSDHWSGFQEAPDIGAITLHYLNGKIHVHIQFPLTKLYSLEQAYEIADKFAKLGKKEEDIAEIKVVFV